MGFEANVQNGGLSALPRRPCHTLSGHHGPHEGHGPSGPSISGPKLAKSPAILATSGNNSICIRIFITIPAGPCKRSWNWPLQSQPWRHLLPKKWPLPTHLLRNILSNYWCGMHRTCKKHSSKPDRKWWMTRRVRNSVEEFCRWNCNNVVDSVFNS